MNKILEEFLTTVDMIYGIYLDSITGYMWAKNHLINLQREMIGEFDKGGENITINDLDQRKINYGEGDLNGLEPEIEILHNCTQEEYKARNSENGLNFKNIGNMCLVMIYQYWEDHYRNELAKSIGREPNEIRIDILGDIRLIRNSIVHHQAIAKKEIEKCVVVNWFNENDEIFLTKDQFNQLVYHLVNGIHQYSLELLS